jgi:hypothetical protein
MFGHFCLARTGVLSGLLQACSGGRSGAHSLLLFLTRDFAEGCVSAIALESILANAWRVFGKYSCDLVQTAITSRLVALLYESSLPGLALTVKKVRVVSGKPSSTYLTLHSGMQNTENGTGPILLITGDAAQ